MSYKPGDGYSKEFVTASPTTGAAADADSLPTATADLDGSGTGAMALAVTRLDAGRYKVTGTIPGTRARGDVLNVSVAATVAGVAGKAIVDTQILDSKRVGDLADFAGGAVASVTAGVTLAPDGLDAISVADPGGVAAQTTFPRRMVALWRHFFAATALVKTGAGTGILIDYAADGTTANATRALADDGTTQAVGAAT